jgi:hypothetical protein
MMPPPADIQQLPQAEPVMQAQVGSCRSRPGAGDKRTNQDW